MSSSAASSATSSSSLHSSDLSEKAHKTRRSADSLVVHDRRRANNLIHLGSLAPRQIIAQPRLPLGNDDLVTIPYVLAHASYGLQPLHLVQNCRLAFSQIRFEEVEPTQLGVRLG